MSPMNMPAGIHRVSVAGISLEYSHSEEAWKGIGYFPALDAYECGMSPVATISRCHRSNGAAGVKIDCFGMDKIISSEQKKLLSEFIEHQYKFIRLAEDAVWCHGSRTDPELEMDLDDAARDRIRQAKGPRDLPMIARILDLAIMSDDDDGLCLVLSMAVDWYCYGWINVSFLNRKLVSCELEH